MTAQSDIDAITAGYTFTTPSIDLGVLMTGGRPNPSTRIRLTLSMLTRHGLIAGATGTGKTRTLQLIAEQISRAGVAVFAADIKGDLSGIAVPGTPSDKLTARTQAIGQDWQPEGCPTEFYSLGGQGAGVPLRATVSSFGPILLAKVLGLNQTQESSLGLVFAFADSQGLPLLDLADLKEVMLYLTSAEGKPVLGELGGLSSATVGVILRSLVTLQTQGADAFFGETEFDSRDLLRVTGEGKGVISLLELPNLTDRPAIFSTFLIWLLADLFGDLPEVGDLDVPKLVFFLDEAHLLFAGASKAFLDAITQTVRLIRSKGVGIFFVTQSPTDLPDEVLAQLGSRIQHQLRAHTPNDAKALKAAVQTYPTSSYDLAETLQSLGIGEAIVTVLNPDGAPTPVAWTRLLAPQGSMGPMNPDWLAKGVAASAMQARYGPAINRESAYEMLVARLKQGAAKAQAEAATEDAEAGAAQAQPARRGSRAQPRSNLERVLGSATFWNQVLRVGSQVARTVWGTARK